MRRLTFIAVSALGLAGVSGCNINKISEEDVRAKMTDTLIHWDEYIATSGISMGSAIQTIEERDEAIHVKTLHNIDANDDGHIDTDEVIYLHHKVEGTRSSPIVTSTFAPSALKTQIMEFTAGEEPIVMISKDAIFSLGGGGTEIRTARFAYREAGDSFSFEPIIASISPSKKSSSFGVKTLQVKGSQGGANIDFGSSGMKSRIEKVSFELWGAYGSEMLPLETDFSLLVSGLSGNFVGTSAGIQSVSIGSKSKSDSSDGTYDNGSASFSVKGITSDSPKFVEGLKSLGGGDSISLELSGDYENMPMGFIREAIAQRGEPDVVLLLAGLTKALQGLPGEMRLSLSTGAGVGVGDVVVKADATLPRADLTVKAEDLFDWVKANVKVDISSSAPQALIDQDPFAASFAREALENNLIQRQGDQLVMDFIFRNGSLTRPDGTAIDLSMANPAMGSQSFAASEGGDDIILSEPLGFMDQPLQSSHKSAGIYERRLESGVTGHLMVDVIDDQFAMGLKTINPEMTCYDTIGYSNDGKELMFSADQNESGLIVSVNDREGGTCYISAVFVGDDSLYVNTQECGVHMQPDCPADGLYVRQ